MQESGQPITAVTFVPRNHQVNSKTPSVVLPHSPQQMAPKPSPSHPVVLPARGLLVSAEYFREKVARA